MAWLNLAGKFKSNSKWATAGFKESNKQSYVISLTVRCFICFQVGYEKFAPQGMACTVWFNPGNTKGGSITVPLTSCLTGLDESVLHIKTKIVSCRTADSKPVKQEVNGTVIPPPLVFPVQCMVWNYFLNSSQRQPRKSSTQAPKILFKMFNFNF